MYRFILLLSVFFPFCLCGNTGCDKHDSETVLKTAGRFDLSTDKARYAPGESVRFTCNADPGKGLFVRYRHLAETVGEEPLTAAAWTWNPPTGDFKGYLVEVVSRQSGRESVVASTAVDVSSDWTRFPRYGFLSAYGAIGLKEVRKVIENLNRHHINGLQFYDWLAAHHRPLAGSAERPAAEWPDLMNRPTYRLTTDNYLSEARARGMKTMFYDLCYGALENAEEEGVDASWYLFTDPSHTNRDKHQLPASFRSSIYLVNPARAEWTDYLCANIGELYQVYGFDGYHIDQLGARSTPYDYDLSSTPGGMFNTLGVLTTDAVIFALGGAHLELGEHMLCNEYFPNRNLSMDRTLQQELVSYYDFAVAYENLLRDGGAFNTVDLQEVGGMVSVQAWPPVKGSVSALGRKVGNRQVIHLHNFANASHLSWRDLAGDQNEPPLLTDLGFRISVEGPVRKVWCATPDSCGEMFREIAFRQEGSTIHITLPWLKYWSMVVIEY